MRFPHIRNYEASLGQKCILIKGELANIHKNAHVIRVINLRHLVQVSAKHIICTSISRPRIVEDSNLPETKTDNIA